MGPKNLCMQRSSLLCSLGGSAQRPLLPGGYPGPGPGPAEPHPSRLARVADQFPAETQLDVLLKTAPPNVLLVTVKAVVPAPQLTRVVQDVAGAAEGRLFYCPGAWDGWGLGVGEATSKSC